MQRIQNYLLINVLRDTLRAFTVHQARAAPACMAKTAPYVAGNLC
jgi:hypothetical protein